jgi:hypothetical protein
MIHQGRTDYMTGADRITDEEYWDLQRRYGGQCVVRKGAQVLVSADTFDELMDAALTMELNWDELVIGYIEPVDSVSVY